MLVIGDEILSGKRADKHMAKMIELLKARGLKLNYPEAVALLSAATLAYYLPRIQAQADATTGTSPASQRQDIESADHKPDIDQLLAQSIPPHPDDVTGTATLAAAPPASPPEQAASPITPPSPDSELFELLKHPPIQFEISSSILTPASRKYLDKLAVLVQNQPHIELSIEGHTDSQNKLGKNQMLSEARARAVLEYLAGKGVATTRMTSAGFGGSQPIADNETAEGRAKNRRIEFEIRNR